MTTFHYPRYERLEPLTEFRGGWLADTDVLTLEEAALMASKHAGETVTIGDFLRAAARGQITLRAINHRTAKLELIGGGVYCNAGTPNENTAPEGAILNLPQTACQHLANVGRARWRTLDGFAKKDGELCRYDRVHLLDTEPDFETVPADCRVTGWSVRALADAFCDAPETQAQPAPTTPQPDAHAPAKPSPDFAKLATREELIDAFGAFTGMDASWFNNLKDTPALLAARKVTGQSGRNNAAPLFCPFEVLQWLISPKRRKGRRMQPDTGWRLLEQRFEHVYNAHSAGDPRQD